MVCIRLKACSTGAHDSLHEVDPHCASHCRTRIEPRPKNRLDPGAIQTSWGGNRVAYIEARAEAMLEARTKPGSNQDRTKATPAWRRRHFGSNRNRSSHNQDRAIIKPGSILGRLRIKPVSNQEQTRMDPGSNQSPALTHRQT